MCRRLRKRNHLSHFSIIPRPIVSQAAGKQWRIALAIQAASGQNWLWSFELTAKPIWPALIDKPCTNCADTC